MIVFCIGCCYTSNAQKEIWLSSPDSNILYSFRLSDSTPTYRVLYKKKALIHYSALKLAFIEGGNFGVNTRMDKAIYKPVKIDTGFALRNPRPVKNHFNEVLIPIVERGAFQRKVNLRVRAYNDGIAFRFELPSNQAWTNFDLTDEQIHFRFAGVPQASNIDGAIASAIVDRIDLNGGIDQVQILKVASRNAYLILSETNHEKQSHLTLTKYSNNLFVGTLPDLPGESGLKMKHALPYIGPWRIISVGSSAQLLPASNMLAELH